MFKYRAIPEATTDPRALKESVDALKENVEILTRQRNAPASAVTWDDLVRLGLISQSDVPRR